MNENIIKNENINRSNLINEKVNKSALFNGSCFALITTAFTFSIRAGILPQLGESFWPYC
ncbi:MAG: hypothetical protein WKG06_46765 [Segetibacter sp.]